MRARKRKPGVRSIIDPKEKKSGVRSGSKAVIKRNRKGTLEATRPKDYAGISGETLAEDRARMEGDGTFGDAPAPRVGGTIERRDGPVRGGTRRMIRRSKRSARRSSASKAARRAAIRAY